MIQSKSKFWQSNDGINELTLSVWSITFQDPSPLTPKQKQFTLISDDDTVTRPLTLDNLFQK